MLLSEWLTKVGFRGGNPFALKQADEEGDLLQEYFVEHPAYTAILDIAQPRSSILHAPRGAGKSTTRRMFEAYCQAQSPRARPLVIRLLDWRPIIERRAAGDALGAAPHARELFRQAVLALAQNADAPGLKTPTSPDAAGYLRWLCSTHDTYLTPVQRRRLNDRDWRTDAPDGETALYDMRALPATYQFQTLMDVIQAIGYRSCYILVDRIDELLETVADWEAGADLLAPLIGNLALAEIPGLAFKYFVPTEVIAILRERGVLRDDRIGCFDLAWNGHAGQELLQKILRSRLMVFSDGRITSLASVAVPDLRGIDEQISAAAAGSPRHLLNLGEWLFQVCADTADDENLFVQPQHLVAARSKLNTWLQRQQSLGARQNDRPAPGTPHRGMRPDELANCTDRSITHSPDGVPLLRMLADGSIWRGTQPIAGGPDLPGMQRALLQYLLERRGKVCRKEAIMHEIWNEDESPASDDSLRKLAERLIRFLEPEPNNPQYVGKVRGGHYVLMNAAE